MDHQLTQSFFEKGIPLPLELVRSPEYLVLLTIFDENKEEPDVMDFVIDKLKYLLKHYPFVINDLRETTESDSDEVYYASDYGDTPTEEDEEVINPDYDE